jgi:hypothetical protein
MFGTANYVIRQVQDPGDGRDHQGFPFSAHGSRPQGGNNSPGRRVVYPFGRNFAGHVLLSGGSTRPSRPLAAHNLFIFDVDDRTWQGKLSFDVGPHRTPRHAT